MNVAFDLMELHSFPKHSTSVGEVVDVECFQSFLFIVFYTCKNKYKIRIMEWIITIKQSRKKMV